VTVGAILTDDGWVCIDTPPYPDDARAWRAALAAISGKPVLYLINTDHHRDRILGNQWFEAPVAAHQAAAEHMLGLGQAFIAQVAEEFSANDNELVQFASLTPVPPQISYTQRLRLDGLGREIELVSRPGPTAGNTWVALPDAKVLFAGDSAAVDRHPYLLDGVSHQWLDGLRDLRRARFAAWQMVPGRGAPIQGAQTQPLSEYLRLARRLVKQMYRANRPRAEVSMLAPELVPLFPAHGTPPDELQRRIRVGLEAIYEEIRREAAAPPA
jgi:cyclase